MIRRSRPFAAAAVWVVICVALPSPQAAVAQDRRPSPSAEGLWDAYPLHQSPEPAADDVAGPSASPTPLRPAQRRVGEEGGGRWLLLTALVVLAMSGAFVVTRVRRRPAAASPVGDASTESGPVVPPDPASRWSAELEWRDVGGEWRFRAIARTTKGGSGVAVAESSSLEWPPSSDASVQALADAAERLEALMVAAGWKPVAARGPWYAKQFVWEPAMPARRLGRFQGRVPWPEESDALWRCELDVESAEGRSRLRAAVYPPRASHGRAIGSTGHFEWVGGPDTELPTDVANADNLVTALELAGWEHVGLGAKWYAHRFVWRREAEPPDHVAPVPTEAGRAS
jgi:hypothetical protein